MGCPHNDRDTTTSCPFCPGELETDGVRRAWVRGDILPDTTEEYSRVMPLAQDFGKLDAEAQKAADQLGFLAAHKVKGYDLDTPCGCVRCWGRTPRETVKVLDTPADIPQEDRPPVRVAPTEKLPEGAFKLPGYGDRLLTFRAVEAPTVEDFKGPLNNAALGAGWTPGKVHSITEAAQYAGGLVQYNFPAGFLTELLGDMYSRGKQAGADEMLDSVRASVKGYPHMGGDVVIMREIEALIQEARFVEKEEDDECK